MYCDIHDEEELIEFNRQDATEEESEEDPFLCEYLNEDTDRLCGQPVRLYEEKMNRAGTLSVYFSCFKPKIVQSVKPEVPMPRARRV